MSLMKLSSRSLICFLSIGLATITTFAVVFSSWITDLNQLGQILHRVFPLARGIFEDKVSNIWCFLSVLPIPARYKLRNLISSPDLAKLSLATTLAVILVPCVQLFVAAAETVRVEMFLDQDVKLQLAASERRKKEGSVAGSVRSRKRKTSRAPPSEAGSDLASILSGGRGTKTETRLDGIPEKQDKMVLASSSPSPAASVLPYALLSTSLAFFLFGFQTHEKSILLPLLPATLLISTKGDEWGAGAGKTDWEWAVLFNNLAVFSMWPLLQRDGLALQYVIMVLLWNWSIGHRPFQGLKSSRQSFVAWFGALAHIGIFSLHFMELLFPLFAPWTNRILSRYPDLFAVLNVLLCTPCFMLIWAWSLKRQLEVGFACGIDILSLQRKSSSKSKQYAPSLRT
jgi:alpha-1,3-glucosyltransferase